MTKSKYIKCLKCGVELEFENVCDCDCGCCVVCCECEQCCVVEE